MLFAEYFRVSKRWHRGAQQEGSSWVSSDTKRRQLEHLRRRHVQRVRAAAAGGLRSFTSSIQFNSIRSLSILPRLATVQKFFEMEDDEAVPVDFRVYGPHRSFLTANSI